MRRRLRLLHLPCLCPSRLGLDKLPEKSRTMEDGHARLRLSSPSPEQIAADLPAQGERRARRARRPDAGETDLIGRALRLAAPLAACIAAAGPGAATEPVSARYAEPTTRYPHGVLGDTEEHGSLIVDLGDGRRLRLRLPEARVFEDTAPRLADVDGDGTSEVVTVESDRDRGARLAVWTLRDGRLAPLAASPFIGTRFRWLAPVGVADLDATARWRSPGSTGRIWQGCCASGDTAMAGCRRSPRCRATPTTGSAIATSPAACAIAAPAPRWSPPPRTGAACWPPASSAAGS